MGLQKLHDPDDGQMRIVGLMSGTGSNLRKIIEFEKKLEREREISPFHVAVIFSDIYDSNANEIGKDFDIPVVTRDINSFYNKRNKPKRDMEVRAEFDAEIINVLGSYGATVAAYAGYMSIATKALIDSFLGINVHPANLSVMEEGKRKYTGSHAVRDAILAGEKFINSTTHIIEEKVDYGRILMISSPLEVELPANFDFNDNSLVKKVVRENQERLKEHGDWIVFPKTLLYLAEGKYAEDKKGNLYFEGEAIPNGLTL